MRMGGLAAFLDERTEQAAREAGGGGMGVEELGRAPSRAIPGNRS